MLRHYDEPQGEVADTTLTRKTSKEKYTASTKTDTGRWGENPKARELSLVKELCKMTL